MRIHECKDDAVENTYQQLAQLIKAMAHPARLRILDLLTFGEACVCHLTTVMDLRQPYVSQQLMVLRERGLVSDRREGTTVYYALPDARVAGVLSLARDVLSGQGVEVRAPTAPTGPVDGCPCPRCVEAMQLGA
jgi:DNA-binding transcriptional ArsR family regulator